MRKANNYAEACAYVNKMYGEINEEQFENELPPVVITIQSKPKSLGHFIPRKDVWSTPNGGTCEINISAEHIGDPIVEVAGTLLHEMVHFYNFLNNVKDCNSNGNYHNKHFRDAAVKHGLIVEKDATRGWALTSPSEEFAQFIIKCGFKDIKIKRNSILPEKKAKSSARKYVCPVCGDSARATKDVDFACCKCHEKLILV